MNVKNPLKLLASCVIILTLAGALAIAVLWLPEWMASQYHFLCVKDWAAQVTANRAMLVNVLGGLAVASTIYFTYRNYKVSQTNTVLAQERLFIETISRSIEQLGNTQMSVRLGGIITLTRIAKISQPDHFRIIEILTGHVQHCYRHVEEENSIAAAPRRSLNCPVEVQTILTAVGDRYWPHPDMNAIDLSCIELSDAWLPEADFRGTYFWFTKLTNWNLAGSNLSDADFKGSELVSCDFTNATLEGANLHQVVMTKPKGLTKKQLNSAKAVPPELYLMLDHDAV